MGTTMLSVYLISLVLCARGAALRSMHLRCLDSERECGKCNYILCAVKALQSSDGQRDLSGKLLDTRSCSLVADKARHLRTYLWEIYVYSELQVDLIAKDATTTVQSSQTRSSQQTERTEKALFILTFNVGVQALDIHIPNFKKYSSFKMKSGRDGDIIDAVFCPGNGKPLKFVYEGSKIRSHTFPILNEHHTRISTVRDILNETFYFLRCDSTSGATLLISDKKIFNGTWERRDPEVALLTVAKTQIMAVSVDMRDKMLYWIQKCPGDTEGRHVDLYRINYSGQKREKKKVTKLEAISSFVVDHYRQHIYACKRNAIRFNMKGQRVQKKNDLVKLNDICANLALYGQWLYILSNTRQGTWFPLNSNGTHSEEFHVKYFCALQCILQVFETPVQYEYLHGKVKV